MKTLHYYSKNWLVFKSRDKLLGRALLNLICSRNIYLSILKFPDSSRQQSLNNSKPETFEIISQSNSTQVLIAGNVTYRPNEPNASQTDKPLSLSCENDSNRTSSISNYALRRTPHRLSESRLSYRESNIDTGQLHNCHRNRRTEGKGQPMIRLGIGFFNHSQSVSKNLKQKLLWLCDVRRDILDTLSPKLCVNEG